MTTPAVFIEPLAAAFRITEQVTLGPGIRFAISVTASSVCSALGRAIDWCRGPLDRQAPRKACPRRRGNHDEHRSTRRRSLDHTVRCRRRLHRVENRARDGPRAGPAVRDGRPQDNGRGRYTVNLAPIVIDEIRVIGSRCGPFPKAIAALAEGRIDVRPLIQAGFPLDQAEDAFIVAGVKGGERFCSRYHHVRISIK